MWSVCSRSVYDFTLNLVYPVLLMFGELGERLGFNFVERFKGGFCSFFPVCSNKKQTTVYYRTSRQLTHDAYEEELRHPPQPRMSQELITIFVIILIAL